MEMDTTTVLVAIALAVLILLIALGFNGKLPEFAESIFAKLCQNNGIFC